MEEDKRPDDSAIYVQVFVEIKQNILTHRYRSAEAVDRELIWPYWLTGRTLSHQVEVEGRGAKVLRNLSKDLKREFPGLCGFSFTNLNNMRQFAKAYPELDEVVRDNGQPTDRPDLKRDKSRFLGELASKTPYGDAEQPKTRDETYFYLALAKELFFSVGFTYHILLLNRCKVLTVRRFCMEEIIRNQWTVDTLEFVLGGEFYKTRGQLPNTFDRFLPGARMPESLKETALLTFRDEDLLDFVNVNPNDERVLERHIVPNIQRFLLSLGEGFSFAGSQYNQVVDGRSVGSGEYYVDLVFYNRVLKSLVDIDLKQGDFEPEYAGKMNVYHPAARLNSLDEIEKLPDENGNGQPHLIGIILCKSRSKIKVGFRPPRPVRRSGPMQRH